MVQRCQEVQLRTWCSSRAASSFPAANLAAGLPDLAVRVLAVLPWAMAAQTAERFRAGRVFLAGDAAHLGELVRALQAVLGLADTR